MLDYYHQTFLYHKFNKRELIILPLRLSSAFSEKGFSNYSVCSGYEGNSGIWEEQAYVGTDGPGKIMRLRMRRSSGRRGRNACRGIAEGPPAGEGEGPTPGLCGSKGSRPRQAPTDCQNGKNDGDQLRAGRGDRRGRTRHGGLRRQLPGPADGQHEQRRDARRLRRIGRLGRQRRLLRGRRVLGRQRR